MDWALEALKEHIHFDSGLWACGHAAPDGAPVVHSHWLHRQPAQLMIDYAPLARHDTLFAESLQKPGVSVVADARLSAPPLFEAYLDRYRIEHVLTTCDVDPVTGLLDDIALWRAERDRPFGEAERRFMQAAFPHLVEAFIRNRLNHVSSIASSRSAGPWSAAAADRTGLLHYAESRFPQLLREEWPDWRGPQLPEPLAEAVAVGESQRVAGENLVVRITPLHDLMLLQARPCAAIDRLTAREREIAIHTAQGLSHKDIARLLDLSPATVRNHLATACRRLGARNKAQLAALVQGYD
ncbi:MAG: helix-turn-helix transcriptional regulator [Caenispirillum sp.]|nr:helix-turn-helix transcriptional regulator [Caenispirillum sp.]